MHATMLVYNGHIRREADLTPLATSSRTAEYLLDGNVVDTETGLPSLCAADDTACPVPDSCDESGAFDWIFNDVTPDKYGGGAVTANLVRLVPVGSTSTVTSLSSIDWTAAGVSGFLLKPAQ